MNYFQTGWNNSSSPSVYSSMKNTYRLFCLLTIVFVASVLFAENHPNFSGKWKLNVQKSEMGASGPTELVVDVDHKDPVFTYTVKGMAGGQQIAETETFTTDGKPSHNAQGITATASWDGPALVVVGTAADGSMVYMARLTLSDDGKTITRAFKQKDDQQLRHEIYDKQ